MRATNLINPKRFSLYLVFISSFSSLCNVVVFFFSLLFPSLFLFLSFLHLPLFCVSLLMFDVSLTEWYMGRFYCLSSFPWPVFSVRVSSWRMRLFRSPVRPPEIPKRKLKTLFDFRCVDQGGRSAKADKIILFSHPFDYLTINSLWSG